MALPDSSSKKLWNQRQYSVSNTLTYLPDSSMNELMYEKPNPRAITLDSLPPCKVCGCTASGLHYGVVSCEACKSFFRRSLAERRKYKCRGKQQDGDPCEAKNYKKCAFCRLQKCKEIGMSRGAIKVGRYTHAQRTLNIVQMKYHKHGVVGRSCRSSTPTPLLNSEVPQHLVNTPLAVSPQENEPVQSPVLEESRVESPSLMNEQSDLIKAIVEANKKHNLLFDTLKDEKDISARQLQYYNNCLLKTELFGPMTAPSWKEFYRFYNITGLEMDERLRFTSITIRQFEALAKSAIKFAKAIPGFKHLTLNDQGTLVKGGYFEYCNICSYRGIDPVLKVAIFVDGDIFTPNDTWSHAERVYVNRLMEFSKRLHNLQITREEDALLQAVVLTASDRAELEQPDRVEKLHWEIIWSLWNFLQQNHDAPSRTFSKIIACLVDLREMTEYEITFNKSHPLNIPELHASQLLCELTDCACLGVKQEPP